MARHAAMEPSSPDLKPPGPRRTSSKLHPAAELALAPCSASLRWPKTPRGPREQAASRHGRREICMCQGGRRGRSRGGAAKPPRRRWPAGAAGVDDDGGGAPEKRRRSYGLCHPRVGLYGSDTGVWGLIYLFQKEMINLEVMTSESNLL
jgi:hypothetical protein